jgi:hypothetical protein
VLPTEGEFDLGDVRQWPICPVCGEIPWCNSPYSEGCGFRIIALPPRLGPREGGEDNERMDGTEDSQATG